MVWRRTIVTAAAAAAAALAASGCGGEGEPEAYRLRPTIDCLRADNVVVTTEHRDFVAGTALGGALRAQVSQNEVVIVFGTDSAESRRLLRAYRRFGTDRPGLEDRLVRTKNVVLVWAGKPSDQDLARVGNCLEG